MSDCCDDIRVSFTDDDARLVVCVEPIADAEPEPAGGGPGAGAEWCAIH